jgi:hypothetical protein
MDLYTLLSHVFMAWCLVWLRLILTLFFHLRHFLSSNLNSSQIICLPKFCIILIPLVSVSCLTVELSFTHCLNILGIFQTQNIYHTHFFSVFIESNKSDK